jgi:hypothetical protein
MASRLASSAAADPAGRHQAYQRTTPRVATCV